jgi:hypothetical protein
MSMALIFLTHGERQYLRDLADFWDDVRDRCEKAAEVDNDVGKLRSRGASLIGLLREKRRTLQDQVRELREAADTCIGRLHLNYRDLDHRERYDDGVMGFDPLPAAAIWTIKRC